MREFEPKLNNKVFTREFFSKYVYILVIGLCLLLGVSYSLTFFVQNKSITAGVMLTENLTINFTDRSIDASGLTVPANDNEGLLMFVKQITVENTSNADGRLKLYLTDATGIPLTEMRYAIIVNGAIQEINNVPANGEVLSTAIMSNERMDIEIRLWPKTTYSGGLNYFDCEVTPEIRYFGSKASSLTGAEGQYAYFNCDGNNCEKWRIVKVEDGRLVLTRPADYEGATSRTNSHRYNPSSFEPALTFNDDSLITSLSTDGKNVYLLRTVKIAGGTGTFEDPYTLSNDILSEPDKKVIAEITYTDRGETVATQHIYANQTNYISETLTDSSFLSWTDGEDDYVLGDTVSFTTDTTLTTNRIVNAVDLSYDNSVSGLNCYDSQCALDELNALLSE